MHMVAQQQIMPYSHLALACIEVFANQHTALQHVGTVTVLVDYTVVQGLLKLWGNTGIILSVAVNCTMYKRPSWDTYSQCLWLKGCEVSQQLCMATLDILISSPIRVFQQVVLPKLNKHIPRHYARFAFAAYFLACILSENKLWQAVLQSIAATTDWYSSLWGLSNHKTIASLILSTSAAAAELLLIALQLCLHRDSTADFPCMACYSPVSTYAAAETTCS